MPNMKRENDRVTRYIMCGIFFLSELSVKPTWGGLGIMVSFALLEISPLDTFYLQSLWFDQGSRFKVLYYLSHTQSYRV